VLDCEFKRPASFVGPRLLAITVEQSTLMSLTLRFREQARSHMIYGRHEKAARFFNLAAL
jgi:hypothetical protein